MIIVLKDDSSDLNAVCLIHRWRDKRNKFSDGNSVWNVWKENSWEPKIEQ